MAKGWAKKITTDSTYPPEGLYNQNQECGRDRAGDGPEARQPEGTWQRHQDSKGRLTFRPYQPSARLISSTRCFAREGIIT